MDILPFRFHLNKGRVYFKSCIVGFYKEKQNQFSLFVQEPQEMPILITLSTENPEHDHRLLLEKEKEFLHTFREEFHESLNALKEYKSPYISEIIFSET